MRSARAARGTVLGSPANTATDHKKTSIAPALAHDEGLTRRERGFVRESAPTFNDLRTVEASDRILEERASDRTRVGAVEGLGAGAASTSQPRFSSPTSATANVSTTAKGPRG